MDRRKLLSTYVEKFIIHRRMWEVEWVNCNKSGLTSNQALTLHILGNSGPQ